jgi:hypothetical protein
MGRARDAFRYSVVVLLKSVSGAAPNKESRLQAANRLRAIGTIASSDGRRAATLDLVRLHSTSAAMA